MRCFVRRTKNRIRKLSKGEVCTVRVSFEVPFWCRGIVRQQIDSFFAEHQIGWVEETHTRFSSTFDLEIEGVLSTVLKLARYSASVERPARLACA